MELKFENGSKIQSIDSGTNKRSIRGEDNNYIKDSTRVQLFYLAILLDYKDEELADFLSNTAYINYTDGVPIDIHELTIEELKGIRDGVAKSVLKQAEDELLKIQPLDYKSEYDGQVNLWNEFNKLNGIARMKEAIVKVNEVKL